MNQKKSLFVFLTLFYTIKTVFNDNKIKYLEQYMFNICPENTNVDGYVTEKLFQSFDAGCIPIYNGGGEFLEPEVVNRKSIILYNPCCRDDFIAQVKELYMDTKYYNDFIAQNRLLPESVDYIYNLSCLVHDKYEKVFRNKCLI